MINDKENYVKSLFKKGKTYKEINSMLESIYGTGMSNRDLKEIRDTIPNLKRTYTKRSKKIGKKKGNTNHYHITNNTSLGHPNKTAAYTKLRFILEFHFGIPAGSGKKKYQIKKELIQEIEKL